MTSFCRSDLSGFGVPIRLARPVLVNSGRVTRECLIRPLIVCKSLDDQFTRLTGRRAQQFVLRTKLFEFDLQNSDDVILQDSMENEFPLIVLREGEVLVNFDICATQSFEWKDSKRPIYTYVPGFNIQAVPPAVRRPLSNFLQARCSSGSAGVIEKYIQLPLTNFEFVVFLINLILTANKEDKTPAFQWPGGKRAVFVPFHDVDTGGFLKRGERDSLFLVEQKHHVRSTWFIPTVFLGETKERIAFLHRLGNEVGWHGYNHDHRLPFSPFAQQRVNILKNSWLCESDNYPAGMRTPKLLKSNHLFDLLDRNCSELLYDTSFLEGIVPYDLWANGRKTRILEIPITVPTDIVVWNALGDIPSARRAEKVLEAQIARTKKLIEVGGVISIVTHPERELSERPELLDVYDQYLSYIKSCPEVGIMTGGELFKYWSKNRIQAQSPVLG
jgi:peptidoglycan/xylan/chitin deacetylase (PgdA/CDA1 family)